MSFGGFGGFGQNTQQQQQQPPQQPQQQNTGFGSGPGFGGSTSTGKDFSFLFGLFPYFESSTFGFIRLERVG